MAAKTSYHPDYRSIMVIGSENFVHHDDDADKYDGVLARLGCARNSIEEMGSQLLWIDVKAITGPGAIGGFHVTRELWNLWLWRVI